MMPTFRYFTRSGDNPRSKLYEQPLALYRFAVTDETVITEQWIPSDQEWIDNPDMIEFTGLGGAENFQEVDVSEAERVARRFGIGEEAPKGDRYAVDDEARRQAELGQAQVSGQEQMEDAVTGNWIGRAVRHARIDQLAALAQRAIEALRPSTAEPVQPIPIHVDVHIPPIENRFDIHVPPQEPPIVNITQAPPVVNVNTPAPVVNVTAETPDVNVTNEIALPSIIRDRKIVRRGPDGLIDSVEGEMDLRAFDAKSPIMRDGSDAEEDHANND